MLGLFLALLAMLAVAGLIVQRGQADLVAGARDAVWEASTPPAQVFSVSNSAGLVREQIGVILAGATADIEAIRRAERDGKAVWDELTGLAPFFPEEVRLAIDRVSDALGRHRAAYGLTLELIANGRREAAQAHFMGPEAAAFAEIGPRVSALLAAMRQRIMTVNARMEATAAASTDRLLLLALAGTALLVGGGLVIVVRLLRPLTRISHAMVRLADDEFGQPVPTDSAIREIARMAASFQTLERAMVERGRLEAEKERARRAEDARALAIRAAARSVQAVVAAASRGDFSRRVATGEDRGEIAEIIEGLDQICATTGEFLDQLQRCAAALAAGDLSTRLPAGFEGRFGRVARDLDRAVMDLGGTVAEAKAASAKTTMEAQEIRHLADELAARSLAQAATIDQLGAAVEVFSTQVASTADAAQGLAVTAGTASRQAGAGSGLAADALGAMAAIEASSRRVGEVADLINTIALQTNLLALNASVEAARAGEHGKGFAVVATEVRRLAVQAAEAAQSVRAMVSATHGQIGEGSDKVRQAATALTDIAAMVQSMTGVVTEIAEAARVQSDKVAEIGMAVGRLDEIKRKNAGASSRNAAVADDLLRAAGELSARMGRFRTSEPPAADRKAA